jgi:hypothetical protein
MNMENNIILNNNTDEEIAVEQENLDESKIKVPFDPSEIEVDTATVNLGYLVNQLELGQINLSPDFQRAADLWSDKKKSRLIESILLGIPIPSFYLSENSQGKLDVIDGLQRLCALKDFIFGKDVETKNNRIEKKYLELSDLEFLNENSNKDYQGITYNGLSREEQLRISGYKITTNTIKKGTPPLVKYIIFQRVNTAGEPLTDQEMRHALNQGIPSKFVKELAETEEFKNATQNKIQTKRMQDRDFANRFLGFYLPENINSMLDEYKKAEDLNSFLNNALIKIGRYKELNIDPNRIKKDFATSMGISLSIFGDDAFRKRYNKDDSRKPISKSVFDTLSVNIAWLTKQEQEDLVSKSDSFKDELILLFNDEIFNRAISYATGQYWSVETRFTMIRELIHKTIDN